MHTEWTAQLSDYLDGDLGPAERAALEAHVAGCAECREVLAGLRRVVARAASLADTPPAADLWPGIAGALGPAAGRSDVLAFRPPRRSVPLPQALAAGLLLAVLAGGSAWLARGYLAPAAPAATAPAPADEGRGGGGPLRPVAVAAPLADPRYDAAVADLRRVLEAGRDRLAPETIAVLERNLALIDAALADAQRALAADPANPYLTNHLTQTRLRKLRLLQQAAVLAGPVS